MAILTDQERLGTLLGERYRIESIIGRGGMGVVFKARQEDNRLPVAVKILRPELAQSDPQFAKRFIREARAAAAIRHPNVVEVYDVGEEPDGTTYQVLELLEGESLRDHLQRRGRLEPAHALELLLPVMHALEAVHAAGVIHRDLKPDNIFLARQPSGEAIPTLLDFGIAKLLDTRGGSFATNTGSIMGTPAYMAPEQATGARDQGPPIDIWAMGVILYECLSGAPPFTGGSPAHVMLRIMTETPPPLDLHAPEVPPGIARATERALVRAQEGRHPTMAAFRQALRRGAIEGGIVIPDEGRPSTTRMLSVIPVAERRANASAEDATIDPRAVDDRPREEGLATMAAKLRAQREERVREDAATHFAGGSSRRAGANDSIDIVVEAPSPAPSSPRRWPVLVAVLALIAIGVGGLGLALGGGGAAPPAATPVVAATADGTGSSTGAGSTGAGSTGHTEVSPTAGTSPTAGVETLPVVPVPGTETARTSASEELPAAEPAGSRTGRTGRGRRTEATDTAPSVGTSMTEPVGRTARDDGEGGSRSGALPGVVGW